MAALQRVTASCVSSTMTTSMRYGSCTGGGGVSLSSAGSVGDGVGLTFAADLAVSDQFPVGLRVLVVDDDTTCLRILEQMLHRCLYNVTSCTQAAAALTLLREKKGCFDVVLSDVHMPDMDGYKLLELVGLEMDLPVIMVSADGRTSAVMKGIKHGACDYLIKPIREEELKNIWQHVVRKKCNENKEGEHSWSMEDSDRQRRANDDTEYASSINEGTGVLKGQKKRSNAKEEDEGELDNDDPSSSKKPRVVWSVELHQQFVIAVNQLGLDKAVPKRILELMNVPGLTRENVASHLQKFRLYLKRLSAQQHSGIANNLFGSLESNVKMGSLGRFDIQALAASGQIPPQTLAAMHAELLGRPTGSLGPIIDQHALLHTSLEGPKHVPVEHSVAFGQPLVKSQCNIAKHVSQAVLSTDRFSSGFGPWLSSNVGTVGSNNNIAVLNSQNSKVLMDIMQQDHQQCLEQKQPPKLQQQSMLPEPSRSMNVQPSCLVLPSQSSASIQAVNSPVSVNQISSLNRASLIDYCNLLPPSNNSTLGAGHVSNGGINTSSVLSGYSSFDSCSTMLPCSFSADKTTVRQSSTLTFGNAGQFTGNVCNISDVQGPYGAKSGEVLGHGPFRHLGFISNGSLPIRLAVDECESMNNMNHDKIHIENSGNVVKLEPSSDIVESARVGVPIVQ